MICWSKFDRYCNDSLIRHAMTDEKQFSHVFVLCVAKRRMLIRKLRSASCKPLSELFVWGEILQQCRVLTEQQGTNAAAQMCKIGERVAGSIYVVSYLKMENVLELTAASYSWQQKQAADEEKQNWKNPVGKRPEMWLVFLCVPLTSNCEGPALTWQAWYFDLHLSLQFFFQQNIRATLSSCLPKVRA